MVQDELEAAEADREAGLEAVSQSFRVLIKNSIIN